jgi:hypothetical protein
MYCLIVEQFDICWECRSQLLSWFVVSIQQADGALGSVVVKVLCYKPQGRGFDSR